MLLRLGDAGDPGFAVNLPEKYQEEAGIRTAWCNLYYDVSYHIFDKSAATVKVSASFACQRMA